MADDLNNLKLRVRAVALLAQASARAAEVQRALSCLAGNPALQSRLSDAAARLSGSISQLSLVLDSPASALHAADIEAIAQSINAGDIQGLVAQATAAAASPAALAQAVATTSADTRAEVQNLSRDMFSNRIFDPYLHFASAADEAEFRRRQAEAQSYVDVQLAHHTPEGDLNAGGGMMGAMLDANAHGAGDSPEFLPRWNALVDKTERQRAAMHAAGQSTAEFDRNLVTSVRSFLRAKGLTDAEIDARMTASANPLDAAKPYLRSDDDSKMLERSAKLSAHATQAVAQPIARVEATTESVPTDVPLSLDTGAMSAKLKAAGLRIPDSLPADTGHGLAPQVRDGKAGPSIGN